MAKVSIPNFLGDIKQNVAVWVPIFIINDTEFFVDTDYTDITETYIVKPGDSNFYKITVSAVNCIKTAIGMLRLEIPASFITNLGIHILYVSWNDYATSREMNFTFNVIANTNDDLASDIATVDSAVAVVDGNVDAIKLSTDNLPADPASNTNVDANEIKIDSVQGDTTAIKAKTDNLTDNPADEIVATANKDEILAGQVANRNINTVGR